MFLKLRKFCALIALILILGIQSSCVPSVGNGLRSRDSASVVSSAAPVGMYQGHILADNPIILSKNNDLSPTYDLNKLVSTATITTNAFLKGNTSCYGLDYCFEVRENNKSPSALQTSNGKWSFNVYSPEFLQVNSFYHLSKMFDMFYSNLSASFGIAYDPFLQPLYDTALPLGLQATSNKFRGINNLPLIAYADCDNEYAADNAFFDRTTQTLCFGYISTQPKVKWAQDSSTIYHELGHYFQRVQLNFRNYSLTQKSDLGNLSYDEAASIGEGLSDYYSYYVNGRTHFAEWGAGRFLQASRPITESDSLHAVGVAEEIDKRLSYPQYLNYNPNNVSSPIEDTHYSGMIISHYLVALSKDLQTSCKMTKLSANNFIVHLLSETLAELGDLTTKGTENNATGLSKVNLSPSRALEWVSKVNPINYRSFSQTFAKNLKNTLANPSLLRCNGSIYTKDQIESLLDQYGLLLFRTYNENRNLNGVNSTVNSLNRKKSQFITKDQLILDPTPGASVAFVIDNRDQIRSGLTGLQRDGSLETLSSQTPSDLGFNNNNGKISPGEVVAIALNLFNNSNATMGGVQILASDWNHADASGKPCQFDATLTSDRWPLSSEGGQPCTTVSANVDSDFAPVCFIQSNENSATKWISQSDFRDKMALDTSLCLNPTNDKNCFIRALKGADQAYYSKINPNSTWGKTLADPKTGKAPSLSWGNVMLFEVSKHIPPGTVIDCRLRARFTNCEDCYHNKNNNNYDFKDKDYNGPTPYKVIHLQIPITD